MIKDDNVKMETRIERNERIRKRKTVQFVFIIIILFISSFMGGQFASIEYEKMLSGSNSKAIEQTVQASDQNETTAIINERIHQEALEKEEMKIEKQWKLAQVKKKYQQESETMVLNSKVVNKINAQDAYKRDGKKVAFLTFDDGPVSNITPQILKILGNNDIKATFFVIGMQAEANPELLKEEVKEGHAIGNHSYSHRYNIIYANPNNLMAEVDKTNAVLKNILGSEFTTTLFRFPGGSFGENKQPFKDILVSKGYRYIDWNALNGDAEGQEIPADKLLARIKATVQGQGHVVILMHDAMGKETTVQALPRIIEYLKAEGYEFGVLQ